MEGTKSDDGNDNTLPFVEEEVVREGSGVSLVKRSVLVKSMSCKITFSHRFISEHGTGYKGIENYRTCNRA